MKRYILIFVIILLPALNFGQSGTYQTNLINRFVFDWDDDQIVNICNDSSENSTFIVGTVYDVNHVGKSIISKISDNGDNLWTFIGADSTHNYGIAQLPNSTYVYIELPSAYNSPVIMHCINGDGTILWEKELSQRPYLISVDADNNQLAINPTNQLIKILNLDAIAQIDSVILTEPISVINQIYLKDNYLLLSGSGGFVPGGWSLDGFLICYQKNGNSWQKKWENVITDGLKAYFAVDNANNIYCTMSNYYTDYSSYITQKLDFNGNIMWEKELFPNYQRLAQLPNSVILLPNNLGMAFVAIQFIDADKKVGFIHAYDTQGNDLFSILQPNVQIKSEYVKAKFDAQKRLIVFGFSYVTTTSRDIFMEIWSIDGITAVEPVPAPLPTDFSLSQNYPNPFNPTTTIQFSLPQAENITLKVFDLLGQEVETLVNEYLPAGTYETTFSGINLPSGIYIYEIKAGKFFIEKKKMVLLK